MSKLARWVCPVCDEGKLAPRRARRDNTATYCLACSAKSPKLVRRVCVAAEAERAKKREKKKERAREDYRFRAPEGYYDFPADGHIGAEINILNWIPYHTVHKQIRVRATRGYAPAKVTGTDEDRVLILHRWPGMDRFDVLGQAAGVFRLWYTGKNPASREQIRSMIAQNDDFGVKPLLNSMQNAEREIADLLRAKDIVRVVTSGRFERAS